MSILKDYKRLSGLRITISQFKKHAKHIQIQYGNKREKAITDVCAKKYTVTPTANTSMIDNNNAALGISKTKNIGDQRMLSKNCKIK